MTDHNVRRSQHWTKAQRLALPVLTPLTAALVGLLIGAVLLIAVGANPISAYGALVDGALGSKNALADTLAKVTPLLFVAIGICVAFRGGMINIGGEVLWLDFSNDGIEIVFNPGFAMPDDVKAAGEQAIEDVKSGAVENTLGG